MCNLDSNLIKIKLVNSFIRHGKKSFSENLIRSIIIDLKDMYGKNADQILIQAFNNLIPKINLKNKRKAGIIYKIPFILKKGGGLIYAAKWFKIAIKNRSELLLKQRILREIIDASNKRGEAYKKKEMWHKTALLNRGFIKYLR